MTHAELLATANPPLPGAGTDGTRREAYRGLAGTAFATNLVVMPAGQRSPARESEVEHVIYVLEGSFEFAVEGDRYEVATMGQIFVPPGVRWEYRNSADATSTFLSVVNR